MGLPEPGATALHHSRTAHGKRLHRELQWQVPRRVSQRELVRRSGRRAGEDRDLAVRLQPGAAALGARISHPGGVRKIVGGDGLWKRRGRGPLGKRFAFPTFPQPRRRREGSYKGCVRELKPGESLIIRGLKMGGRSFLYFRLFDSFHRFTRSWGGSFRKPLRKSAFSFLCSCKCSSISRCRRVCTPFDFASSCKLAPLAEEFHVVASISRYAVEVT